MCKNFSCIERYRKQIICLSKNKNYFTLFNNYFLFDSWNEKQLEI